jgi:AraC family transcriptional activator of pyochelin receptor
MAEPITEINIEKGFLVLKTINDTDQKFKFNTKRKDLFIQLHFTLSGTVWFHIIKGTHKLEIPEQTSLSFFNPKNLIPIDGIVEPKSKMLSVLFSIDAIHKLFEDFSIDFNFLSPKNKQKKLYSKKPLAANEFVILTQIFNRQIQNKLDFIYIKAKILELFTYYFNDEQPKNSQTDSQNLKNEKVIEKIKKAKKILVANINEPPAIEDLADEVMLPINVLKNGFKEMYGEPIYKYILSYKLELSRHLLMSKKYSVKEISYQMGYSAPTHFVVAFKKKYGVTPKKYIQNL